MEKATTETMTSIKLIPFSFRSLKLTSGLP